MALLGAPCVWAQEPTSAAPVPAPDPLGRDTPRGTAVGFFTAARDGKYEIAAQYLDAPAKAARDVGSGTNVVVVPETFIWPPACKLIVVRLVNE